jgi:hypothetical protein
MVERHKAGKPGQRGVDVMGQMFGELVASMDICGSYYLPFATYF